MAGTGDRTVKNQSRNRKTDLGGYLIQGKLGTVEYISVNLNGIDTNTPPSHDKEVIFDPWRSSSPLSYDKSTRKSVHDWNWYYINTNDINGKTYYMGNMWLNNKWEDFPVPKVRSNEN